MEKINFRRIFPLLLSLVVFLTMGSRGSELGSEDKKEQDKLLEPEKRKKGDSSRKGDKADPNAAKIIVKLRGLVCDFCARALEKVFGKREEVSSLSVDLRKKLLTIRLKKGYDLSDETVRKLVEDAGYNTVNIRRKGRKK